MIDSGYLTDRLLDGTISDPHAFLGLHPVVGGLQVRVFAPAATSAELVEVGGEGLHVPLRRDEHGIFHANIARRDTVFPYLIQFRNATERWTRGDPYRFLPVVGEQDLFFFGEGTHRHLYRWMGAHARTIDGEDGVSFAVWAPVARGVSVMGDFNGWNRRDHPMRSLGPSGVWELFVPGLSAGGRYKFAIRGADGREHDKADPMARQAELRPATASVVAPPSTHEWGDGDWMARRAETDAYHAPMSVYEVHLGSWRRHEDGSWLGYREAGDQLADYCLANGFTHVELMPLTEHPFDGSWGYQVTAFYAPTARYGSPDDLRAFVDTLHQAGIGVIMDWVPAHFAIDDHGLARFDGSYLYDHEDSLRRFQPDWGTLSFNYGRHEVRNFLIANGLYWIREFHLDGLRVDAVSAMLYLDYSRKPGEWAPNRHGGREHLEAIDFLQTFNVLVYEEGEGAIVVAEESTAWPGVSRPVYAGGLGFGFKWNMGWMHDTLDYLARDPIHRRYHQGVLTFSMVYAYTENFVLSLSHDEVVHGKKSLLHKMPGDEWQQFANLRLLYAYMHAQPGKKLMFMGGEFGQRREWSHEGSLEWSALDYGPHAQALHSFGDLNRLHVAEPALHWYDHDPRGFDWLDFSDAENSVLAFVRRAEDPADDILCVFNFTPLPRYGYRIPVSAAGRYREIFNSDAAEYGGSGVGNGGEAVAEARPYHGREAAIDLTLPPLGAVFLKRIAGN